MSNPSPGWYPDPTTEGSLRFFDGENWTQHSVPTPQDGQLSPAMIATGRKVMQEKSAQKFLGSLTPRSIGEAETPVTSNLEADTAQREVRHEARSSRTADSAVNVEFPREPNVPVSPELQPSVNEAGVTLPGATVSASETSRFQPVAMSPAESIEGAVQSPSESPSELPSEAQSPFDASAASLAPEDGVQAPVSGDAKQSEEVPGAPGWSMVVGEESDASSYSATVDSFDATAAPKKSDSWLKSNKWIFALLIGLLVIGGAVWAMFKIFDKDDTIGAEPSKDYQALGLKTTFDCDALAEEVIALSRETPDEVAISSIEDAKMVVDNRSKFELPSAENSFETAFECVGTAYHEDGKSSEIKFSVDVDQDQNFWTSYDQRKS